MSAENGEAVPVTGAAPRPGDNGGSDPRRSSGGDLVPFRVAVRTWFGISLQTFGGPAGQIAVMQRILVDEKR